MKRISLTFMLLLMAAMIWASPNVKIKDIAHISGIRSNQLMGYGVVVGLDGTGDTSNMAVLSTINMLKKYGVDADIKSLKPSNVAAVMVTATLPPFANEGEKISVLASSIADATNLQGGVLLQTPLLGADGKVYAVAEGPISVGGLSSGGGGRGMKNHLTVAKLPEGAIIEKNVAMNYIKNGKIDLLLNTSDFTTASRVKKTVNSHFGLELARAVNPGLIEIKIPVSMSDDSASFVASILQLKVNPDDEAKIVINERTGTIVMGEQVPVSSVSIVHGDLKVTVSKNNQQNEGTALNIKEGANVQTLVDALNSVGATSKDIIAILQAMKEQGALHAELKLI
jgi:flagellar P-ring protein precursor FlgI